MLASRPAPRLAGRSFSRPQPRLRSALVVPKAQVGRPVQAESTLRGRWDTAFDPGCQHAGYFVCCGKQ